jgi:hypothetical protein
LLVEVRISCARLSHLSSLTCSITKDIYTTERKIETVGFTLELFILVKMKWDINLHRCHSSTTNVI